MYSIYHKRIFKYINNLKTKASQSKTKQHYSRYTDKGPSIAERVIRIIRKLLKKPVFLAGNADWLSELSAVINKYKKSFHNSIKMTPIQASKKVKEKEICSNLKDKREIRKTKI